MMIRTIFSVAAAVFLVLAATTAAAQVGPVGLIQMPPLYGDFRPADGIWVEYKVHETDSDTVMEIKIAVLGHEKCVVPAAGDEAKKEAAGKGFDFDTGAEGADLAAPGKPDKKGKKGKAGKAEKAPKPPPPPKKDCYWIEVVTQLIDGPSAAVKIYSEGDPRDVKNIRRLLNRAGKRPAVEAKPEALAKLKKFPGGTLPKTARSRAKKDVVTALETNDKIMSTVHEFHGDGVPYVVWSSERVPLFGVAKLQAPNLKIDVMKFGKNYKTTFPDVKAPAAKMEGVDKPGPLDIQKPKQDKIEEVRDKLQEDYKRPDLESIEPAVPAPEGGE
ncbi:MAG: hypothetical protein HY897_18080 [Deltaproteobacteria bacterium]|nr:hypothetical protein [Deltaproteobacteria bacterium]